jgi:hypothetical protein
MADKRISQLVERTDIANNDVVPIVASGATTTNKATISSIQEFMQENLDLGVTSVGITLGSSGTDVSVTGSPITTSGNITINFPTASATNRGLLSPADWTTFNDKQPAGNYVTLDTAQTITAQKVFTTSGSSDSVIITHGSGSGFALDVIKAGNGEVVRVNKTSGSGNAMSIIGGNFGAEDATFSKDIIVNGVNVGRGGGNISGNVILGSTLVNNTTGIYNVAINGGALGSNTTGRDNVAIGYVSLNSNTSGERNTAVGGESMYDNLTGSENTAIGLQALSNMTTGKWNVSIGNRSATLAGSGGGGLFTSNNSIYIGYDSRAGADNQTNQIVIGHLAIGNGSNTVTIGNSSITDNYFTGNIRGGAFIRTGGTSSQFLKADGSVDSSSYLTTGSAASTYLPLTGGILTGGIALTSGNLEIAAGNGAILFNPANTQYFQLYTNASNELNFGYGGTSPVVAKIAATGAVTLTGALNGTSASFTGDVNLATSSGNVGIGTASPSTKLQVQDGFISTYHPVNLNGAGYGIQFFTNGGGSKNTIADIGINQDGTTRKGDITFNTSNGGAPTERMRITSSGNVGIGTASPNLSGGASGSTILTVSASASARNAVLELNGTRTNSTDISGYVRFFNNGAATPLADIRAIRGSSDTSGDLAFTTADTERMRITSGGYLKASSNGVYNDSAGIYHEMRQTGSSQNIVVFRNGGSDPYGLDVGYPSSSPNNTVNNFIYCFDSTAQRFSVRSNGGIANYATNNVVLSDERLKKDIAPLESYWDKFKAIEIVKYKYIDQTHDDFNIGVIAQQVEAIAPEFVDIDGWDTNPKFDEEGNEILSEEEPLKSVYASDLHHATIKVLQEAMAKIEKLETEIDSLKNQIK